MRNPRRPNRKRKMKSTRLVVENTCSYSVQNFDPSTKILTVTVPSQYFHPWTPGRGRSKHFMEVTKLLKGTK